MKNNLLITLAVTLSLGVAAQKKPNVIVVLADDIGLGDISYYRKMHSNDIIVETPAIDQLAKEGMTFTDAHSPAALCAPTRASIMSGQNCYRSYAPWGVWGSYQQSPIKEDQLTLGKLMKSGGYQTAFFGKWGFGSDFYEKNNPTKIYRANRGKVELDVDITRIAGNGPKQNGFDYSYMFPSGIQNVPYAAYENEKWSPFQKHSKITFISQENMTKIGVKLDKDEGLGDSNWDPHHMGPKLIGKAINFIENSSKDKPFFMYYCALAVHLPHTPSESLNGKKIAGTTPSSHLDVVKELDVQIEMLVQSLKKKGVYDNTIIIFTSDNGGLQVKEDKQAGHQSSDIYRGSKNQPYEGGHRVPFIAWWPGQIKAKTINTTPVLGLDVMATLAAITDQKLPENQQIDSANLLPLLLGKNKAPVHPYIMTQSGTSKEGVIIEDGWKLIIAFDKKDKSDTTRTPHALFNLVDNVEEKESGNLINVPKYKVKVEQLFAAFNAARDGNKPTKN
ncbi:sulfatase family protein [Flavobacterium sp. 7A]|uniref:sulfatase family protein n=1 Tax=Flavobacterium sp. 7A TaxID=2940571 RepID=UPI0022280613|nr:arylsulfatase [Flavobacterium sp. 7A]MCW2120730.1 arylsulfatase A-like enzyme [Flavobacterium sp. 7A]